MAKENQVRLQHKQNWKKHKKRRKRVAIKCTSQRFKLFFECLLCTNHMNMTNALMLFDKVSAGARIYGNCDTHFALVFRRSAFFGVVAVHACTGLRCSPEFEAYYESKPEQRTEKLQTVCRFFVCSFLLLLFVFCIVRCVRCHCIHKNSK